MRTLLPFLSYLGSITIIIVLTLRWARFENILNWIFLPDTKKTESQDEKLFPNMIKEIFITLLENWYVLFFMAFVIIVVLKTEVGYDMIQSFLESKHIICELSVLTFLLVIMSLAIWVIPFWLVDEKKYPGIGEPKFITKTILITFLSLMPYGIIGTAFMVHSANYSGFFESSPLGIYSLLTIIFLIIQKLGRERFLTGIKWLEGKLAHIVIWRKIKNNYWKLIFYNILFHSIFILFCLLISILFSSGFDNVENKKIFMAIYPLISGLITFHLLYSVPQLADGKGSFKQYFTDGTLGKNTDYFKVFLDKSNKESSKCFFLFIFGILALIVLFFYFSPNLSWINTLYIIIPLFGLNIVIVNYLRNLFRARRLLYKVIGLIGIIGFLALPFIPVKEQFNIDLLTIDKTECEESGTLEEELLDRANAILRNETTIYIVCGMGGGSRAGYVIGRVLDTLESEYPHFYEKTLFYSTVSGSSPGVYHYLKGREIDDVKARTEFFKDIYNMNYNSSGVFSLFTGDNLDALLGFVINVPLRKFLKFDQYYNRNERIKYEYNSAMKASLVKNNKDQGVRKKDDKRRTYVTDRFVEFFHEKDSQTIPIQLINSFEVNSGKRAILSPFKIKAPDSIFPNVILPLQDVTTTKDCCLKDIYYYDAVNLSELFPFLSAAAIIDKNEKKQYVDGGYYDNNGLTTALDVYHYFEKHYPDIAKRIRILLIKNSTQKYEEGGVALQLFAPLVGLKNAPFTGHANYLSDHAKLLLDKDRFKIIEFNEQEYNVSLTRALTEKQIDSIDHWIVNHFSKKLDL